jgi:hypothetical protein
MAVIMFKVREGLAEDERQRLLAKIASLPDVEVAQAVREGAKTPSLRRLHYVRLKDDAVVGHSLDALRGLADVEHADLSSTRGLA